jgi:hypothetical protein
MRENRLTDLFTQLTTVKLALQLLKRRSNQCHDPDGLIRKALSAMDDVVDELRADRAGAALPQRTPFILARPSPALQRT